MLNGAGGTSVCKKKTHQEYFLLQPGQAWQWLACACEYTVRGSSREWLDFAAIPVNLSRPSIASELYLFAAAALHAYDFLNTRCPCKHLALEIAEGQLKRIVLVLSLVLGPAQHASKTAQCS